MAYGDSFFDSLRLDELIDSIDLFDITDSAAVPVGSRHVAYQQESGTSDFCTFSFSPLRIALHDIPDYRNNILNTLPLTVLIQPTQSQSTTATLPLRRRFRCFR